MSAHTWNVLRLVVEWMLLPAFGLVCYRMGARVGGEIARLKQERADYAAFSRQLDQVTLAVDSLRDVTGDMRRMTARLRAERDAQQEQR